MDVVSKGTSCQKHANDEQHVVKLGTLNQEDQILSMSRSFERQRANSTVLDIVLHNGTIRIKLDVVSRGTSCQIKHANDEQQSRHIGNIKSGRSNTVNEF